MKHFIVPALFAATAFGQTTNTPVNFPAVPLPVAVSAFGDFNQLGSPRFTMGISAIYPVVGSAGVYGTTTADILPRLAVDPITGKKFYAISSSLRQGFHKDILDTGQVFRSRRRRRSISVFRPRLWRRAFIRSRRFSVSSCR